MVPDRGKSDCKFGTRHIGRRLLLPTLHSPNLPAKTQSASFICDFDLVVLFSNLRGTLLGKWEFGWTPNAGAVFMNHDDSVAFASGGTFLRPFEIFLLGVPGA